MNSFHERAALPVEQEYVDHDVLAGLADGGQHGVEDLLSNYRRAEHVGAADVAEELDLLQRRIDDVTAHPRAVGQWFEHVPQGDQRPGGEETVEKQPTHVPVAALFHRGRRWIYQWLVGHVGHRQDSNRSDSSSQRVSSCSTSATNAACRSVTLRAFAALRA